VTDTHILLDGQSNALGFLNEGPAPYMPTPRVQIYALQADGVTYQWNYMLPGYNTGTPANPRCWGPEVQFANRWLQANPSGNLWICKTAKGSTALAAGVGVDWSPESTGEEYSIATTMINAARHNLDGSPYAFSQWDGVLWMQGEQDALTQATANAYQANLEDLITHARADWAVSRFVVGRITDSPNLPYNLAVRQAQWAVPLEMADVISFKTIGFAMREDLIHYSDVGHFQLGNAFYDAWVGP
jgi:hypothetical protein